MISARDWLSIRGRRDRSYDKGGAAAVVLTADPHGAEAIKDDRDGICRAVGKSAHSSGISADGSLPDR